MELLNELSNYRTEVLEYIRPHLSNKSYTWCRGVLNDIVRSASLGYKCDTVCKTIISLANFKKFFEVYASEITAGGILITIYAIGIQLGLRELGDSVEAYDEFIEQINEEDWKQVSKETITDFDLVMRMHLMENLIQGNIHEVLACGINTLVSVA